MNQFARPSWWQTGVIYQIYPRSFLDTGGDGIGDLGGILDRLDYLNGSEGSLGVDAIWISPFYPSPMADFGYDVSNYVDVHPDLGSLELFDRLVAEAHQRRIRVIIDYVPNHTSDRHPWFQEARSRRDHPRRDWYIWRNPGPDGALPNNWGSVFGGPAWTWDESAGQYYFHQFLKEQPDLNWRNPEVQEAMLSVLKFWLDRGVDGFRMDVVGMIFKHPDMPDQPLDPAAPASLRPNDLYARQIHLHDQDQPEVYEMVRRFNALGAQYGDVCLIGETLWHSMDRWVKYYGPSGDGLHLPMNFRFMELPWTADSFRSEVARLEAALPAGAWPSYVLGNHDVPRLASRYGQAATRLAAMLLLTLRGTPILYYGDEIGLEDGRIDPGKIQDPWGLILGPEFNRDVCRTPMQWDGSAYAGFSAAAPWLPVSDDAAVRNIAVQTRDPHSLLNLYRELIRFRRSRPALQTGSLELLESPPEALSFRRQAAGQPEIRVALNFSSSPAAVSFPYSGRVAVSTDPGRAPGTAAGGELILAPYEGVIVED